jgi:polysaccharide biosynthesis protein PslG
MHVVQGTCDVGLVRRISLVSVAVASALAILLAPAGASAASPTVPWGFNEDWGWSNGGFNSAQTANLHMQKAGAIMPDALSANRLHVMWSYVEGTRGRYDWSVSDAQYAAMQTYTRRPIMMLGRAPAWARDPARTCAWGGDEHCMYPQIPKYDTQWKAFVKAATARYRNVRAIEIWNEPNLARFWSPAADPVRYATILKQAHSAVRSASSSVPVVTGGIFPVATANGNVKAATFLSQIYTTAGASAFEGIGSHPYVYKAPYVDGMRSRLDALRSVRNQKADSATPLWVTEAGIATDSSGVPADQQGAMLTDLYHSIEGTDVRSFVIHRFYDVGGDFYGVVNNDLTPKPAYCGLGAAIGTAC